MDVGTVNSERKGDLPKILLAILPYWTPLIPPMGIASLKSYLSPFGYNVKTIDATVEVVFKELYNEYFGLLERFIPQNNRGNFFNIGHDVLQNHMMVFMNRKDESEIISMVQPFYARIFYHPLEHAQIMELDRTVGKIFAKLRIYFEDLIEKERPDVVGLTVHIHTLPASLFAFKLVKQMNPMIKTVMGGGIFTEQLAMDSENLDYFIKNTPDIDAILAGEGERLLLKYLQGELSAGKKFYSLHDIPDGNLDFAVQNLPDFSDFNLSYYLSLVATGSISCPFQCKFCSETVYFGKYRKKNTDLLVAEMQKMHEKYGRQIFFMTDSLLNPIIDDLAEALLNKEQALYWYGCLRVSPVVADSQKTLLWRQAGFYSASLGIETGSSRMLELMDKKITIEQSKASLRALAYAGIKTTTYWVVGYPGESEEDFLQTLAYLEELKDDIYEAESHPFQFLNGLVNYHSWSRDEKTRNLYPEIPQNKLIIKTCCLDTYPPRDEIYRRLNRFVAKCNELGIPNAYSEKDIYLSDERWKRLHKNAVPSILEFKDPENNLDDRHSVKKLLFPSQIPADDGDFQF